MYSINDVYSLMYNIFTNYASVCSPLLKGESFMVWQNYRKLFRYISRAGSFPQTF